MELFNDEILEVFANGIMDAVAEYISNVIGYENMDKPGVTLEEAVTRGLEESAVDDSYERYGIETIFRLLEQNAVDDIEDLDVYRQKNTDKVIALCLNYYKKVFANTWKANPGITVDEFTEGLQEEEPFLSDNEVFFTLRSIMKVLKDHESYVNDEQW